MVRKLLSNKFVFAAVVVAFVLAMGVSAAWGNSLNSRSERIIDTSSGQRDFQSNRQALAVAMDPTQDQWPYPTSGGTQRLAVAMDPTQDQWPYPTSGGSHRLAVAMDPTQDQWPYPTSGVGSLAS